MKIFRLLFVSFLLCGSAMAAPTIVQQATCSVVGGSLASCVATLGANVTAGNSVLVLIGTNGGTHTVSTVTGGGITTFTSAANVAGTSILAAIWYGHASDGSSAAITINTAAAFARMGVVVLEVSGLANAGPEATNTGSALADANPSTGSATPSSASSIVVAVGAWIGNDYSSGPTNSFTRTNVPTNSTTEATEGAYQIESSAAAYSTGWTLTTGVNWATAIAAFGATSGPTPAQRSAGFFMPPQ